MKSLVWSSLLLCAYLGMAVESGAQTPVGALAIDERQGDQHGWAVDYATAAAAQGRALQACGAGCSVVLTFGRWCRLCGGPGRRQHAGGLGGIFDSAAGARQAALRECRVGGGGSDCVVRVWGCNGSVVEEGLNLDRAARRRIQEALQAAGFDPGSADGLFGPRTRAAIRNWQSARGTRATGYLDGAAVEALRGAGEAGPAVEAQTPAATQVPPAATAEQETVFWQSIADSSNPTEYEAYLAQFPNGVFGALARARLAALRSAAADPPGAAGTQVGVAEPPPGASGGRVSGAAAPAFGTAASDTGRWPGEVFRDCAHCPEMVVLPGGGGLAMGRYEVTLGEYRAFASATGGGTGRRCAGTYRLSSWRDPGFPQTDRHPVTCVSWNDAQAYVS